MAIKCDVLVIGGGIAGLSAALSTTSKGLKTILIEKQNIIGGKAGAIEKKGFIFDPGPSICIMKWVYEDLFRSSVAEMSDYLQFEKLDPAFSLIPENGKPIAFPFGRKNFLKKIADFSPGDTDGFKKLFSIGESLYPLVKKTFFSKSYSSLRDFASINLLPYARHLVLIKKYKSIIDAWFHNPILKAWLYSFPTYTGQSYNSIAPGALLIPYIMICEGIYYPRGGIGSIPQAIAKRAKELKTEIITNCSVTKLTYDDKKVLSVHLSDGRIMYPRAVISSIDQFETKKLLNIPSVPSASYSYVSLQIGINKKINTLTHHTSCIPLDYKKYYTDLYQNHTFPLDPLIYIHTPSATHPECAPNGYESIFLVIPTHAQGAEWLAVEKNLIKNLLRLLKKYNIKISEKDIKYVRMQTPRYFEQTHGNYFGSLFGPDESKRVARILPPDIHDNSLSNLVFCGGGVQPGAGMPMVTLSGKFASEYVAKIL